MTLDRSAEQAAESTEQAPMTLPFHFPVLVTIPPNPSMDALMESLSIQLPAKTWVGVVSTTGVYGNHNGEWVNEDSPLLAKEDSMAYQYIEYEQKWQNVATGKEWTLSVFRCSGLYGSQRSALHTIWKMGCVPTPRSSEGVTNRIHEEDVARCILNAMRKATSGVYNLSDDLPETRSTVMAFAANLLSSIGATMPPCQRTGESSTRSRRRRSDVKRVSNSRMKDDLVDELVFPSYRQGLSAVLNDKATLGGLDIHGRIVVETTFFLLAFLNYCHRWKAASPSGAETLLDPSFFFTMLYVTSFSGKSGTATPDPLF
eukprot:CAMPEP_0116845590 /NCGR_PEP_ID=MMETSP0418-20121206/13354_1 /TAXON_ID=1158023 /ORGANISM="Astrosyne radiata, Strain 13vi08-1A" /LENGTH=314 /DNA_ID=CAMNT_0004476723 /DNA_START=17 /DNA_END=962 /DNA_ORIENTATION=+